MKSQMTAIALTKLRYTVPEFITLTGTPRSTVFQRINRGELKVVRDGRKVFITADEMIRYSHQSQPLVQAETSSVDANG